MDLGLTGKTVVVTGGGRGIGKEICLTFAREGANIVIADIDERSACETADEVQALGVESLGIALVMKCLMKWICPLLSNCLAAGLPMS